MWEKSERVDMDKAKERYNQGWEVGMGGVWGSGQGENVNIQRYVAFLYANNE